MQMELAVGYTACKAAYNLCEDWLNELITYIQRNAEYVEKFMADNFPEIKCIPLEGTYLQWIDMRGLGTTHVELKKMLEDNKIYLDNGEVFGPAGRGFQRINLACALETLEKTMARFKAGVEKVKEDWKKNGKPVHTPFENGKKLEGFIYNSPEGNNIDLAEHIKNNPYSFCKIL